MNTLNLVHRGLIEDELKYDRVREWNRPENIYFRECKNIKMIGITLKKIQDLGESNLRPVSEYPRG